jgi:Cft2 family RNA processing exonuclease
MPATRRISNELKCGCPANSRRCIDASPNLPHFPQVSDLTLQFLKSGIYLPELYLWLDPSQSKEGKVFVSHAHSDHIGRHREVILSAPTAKLMRARINSKAQEHILPFGERRAFIGPRPYTCSLWPAGHIFGSAMIKIEVEGCSLLYTGDFKLRRSLSAELCEPQPADILIMESTFGRARYRFPPAEEVMRAIIRFCRATLDKGETPVLYVYSLGKSQELLCGLAEAGLPIMVHSAIYELTRIYEEFGHCFPKYDLFSANEAQGKVLLCPPGANMLRDLAGLRSAIMTGWAVDSSCRYLSRTDAAFPLSDHSDFPDLLALVKAVSPRKIYTVHGFAAEFACTLRELGYDACAPGQAEQLTLPLGERMQLGENQS